MEQLNDRENKAKKFHGINISGPDKMYDSFSSIDILSIAYTRSEEDLGDSLLMFGTRPEGNRHENSPD